MTDKVYNLRSRTLTGLDNIQRLCRDPDISQEDFFSQCIEHFPVASSRLHPETVEFLRRYPGWVKDAKLPNSTQAFSNNHSQRMLNAVADENKKNEQYRLVHANALPEVVPGVPLLNLWQEIGNMLYGTKDFGFAESDALKRQLTPTEKVVGYKVHGDVPLDMAHDFRMMSIFCNNCSMAIPSDDPSKAEGPWWSTIWYDMSQIGYDEYKQLMSGKDSLTPEEEQALAGRLPHHHLPVQNMIIMPTFMWHQAGGMKDAPDNQADIVPQHPQPYALIEHATVYKSPTQPL